jgi:macrolide transport system ATP-binding/permease protein
MDSLKSDVKFAARALAGRPGFAALAVLTLAVGIGVNAVVFSAINGLLFKPANFPDFERLGWIGTREPGNPNALTSWPNYRDIARASRTFDAVAACGRMPLSLRDGNAARQIWAQVISANYFPALRAQPAIGRLIAETDLATPDVPVVVSHRFWTDSLGGGESVAGRSLTLNGRTAAIVGVAPDSFQGPCGLFEPDVWVPLDRMAALNMPARLSERSEAWLGLFGRLAPGTTPAQGAAELRAIGAALAEQEPVVNKNRALIFTWMPDGNPDLNRIAPIAYLGLSIVGLVLLIACFNVAGLLLGRAAERQREISVRTALGAARLRIVRQFALEGLMLAFLSGIAAVVLASWSADLLSVFSLPSPIPQRLHMSVDRRLVAFIAAMVALGGVLPTLLPALQATRVDLLRSMRMETMLGQRRSRATKAFVVAQIAGSTLFLATALLFVRTFWNSASSDPGFETTRLLVVELKPSDYGYDPPRARALLDSLVERLRGNAGVQHAAIGDRVSFYVGYPKVTRVATAGESCAGDDCRIAYVYGIGDGYFAAFGVPLKAGRDFTLQEIRSGTAAIVSETMAAHLWPGRNAVGEWLRDGRDGRQLQVVGVAADITHRAFGEPPADYIYRPLRAPEYSDVVTLVVRTTGEARGFGSVVQQQLQALDPNLPAGSVKTMAQRMEMPLWPFRTAAGFFTICGTLALVLASVGLFGMTYLTVSQRTREFGIRAALGATRARVMRLVLGEGLWLAIPGISLGLIAAVFAARIAASSFFRISPADPAIYAVAGILQTMVALAACLLPAYKATETDPMLALRQE